jgi:CHAT domain-containing protein
VHGAVTQDWKPSTELSMCDQHLMISDITQISWQNLKFAFLSGCHTTVGDTESFDESLHLTVVMQFSVFSSVIISTWSVDNNLVVFAFYDGLVDAKEI